MVTLVALFEAIEQTLLLDARAALLPAIQAWGLRTFREIMADIGMEDLQSRITQIDADDRAGDGEASSRLRDEASVDCIGALSKRLADGTKLVDDMRDLLSRTLSKVARAHIEGRLGPITTRSESGEDGNLYWLQHIIVHLRGDKVGANGTPVTSGGSYNASPNLRRDFLGSRQSAEVQPGDASAGILIQIDDNKLRAMIHGMIMEIKNTQLYGESMRERDDPVETFLQAPLSTFVHEVVHMEQDSRAGHAKKRGMGWGMSHLPAAERRTAKSYKRDEVRGSAQKNAGKYPRTYRPGKRGHPDHLNSGEMTDARFSNYYGTNHEIEAHAAGAASSILNHLVRQHDHYSRRFGETPMARQQAINDKIDNEIRNLSAGDESGSGHGSLDAYREYARDVASKIEKTIKQPRDAQGNVDPARRRYPLPKVDELHRKVWRLFMMKLVRHLLAHRKRVDWDEGSYYAAREPRPAKVGGITHPARKPRLPDGDNSGDEDY